MTPTIYRSAYALRTTVPGLRGSPRDRGRGWGCTLRCWINSATATEHPFYATVGLHVNLVQLFWHSYPYTQCARLSILCIYNIILQCVTGAVVTNHTPIAYICDVSPAAPSFQHPVPEACEQSVGTAASKQHQQEHKRIAAAAQIRNCYGSRGNYGPWTPSHRISRDPPETEFYML